MKPDTNDISELLKQFIKNNGLEKGLNNIKIKEVWVKVMGASVNNYTKSVKLVGSQLVVTLNSPQMRQELSFGKTKIIDAINKEVGYQMVEKVVLK